MQTDKKEITMKCYKCGHSYTVDQMRYGPDGKTLMCINCIERRHVEPIQVVEHKKEVPKKAEKAKEGMTKYRCTSCNYKFSRASHLNVTKCPYCSKPTIEQDGGIQSLIDHAEDEDEPISYIKKPKKW